MTTDRTDSLVSRRAAVAGLAGGGLALAASRLGASAHEHGDLAGHPLAGWWLAMANPVLPDAPQIAIPSLFAADGSVVLLFPVAQAGPDGIQYISSAGGTWEPDSDRRGHFTAVQSVHDANGTFVGTTTIDGYPEVSEDGESFIDDGSRVTITIRDPSGAVVDSFPGAGARPVTARRMGPGAPGFPEGTPEAGTPVS